MFKKSSKNLLSDGSFISILFLIVGVLTFTVPYAGQSQGLADGFFRGAGNADITFSTTFENGDEFWAGESKMDVPPFYGEISRTTYSLFIAYGITDNIDVNLNLPYIVAKGDGEGPASEIPPQDFDAVQDGELTLKWRPVRTQLGPGSFNLIAAGALAVPLSDYENGAFPDEQSGRPILVAIGDHTTRVSGSLVAQYEFNSGLFTSLEGGYRLSGETGDADLDVPNASFLSGKLGYGTRNYYGAVWVAGQFSEDGTDIGQGPFPTNQVDYSRFGLTGSVSILPSINLNAGYFTTIDGRNTTQTDGFTVGVTFSPGN